MQPVRLMWAPGMDGWIHMNAHSDTNIPKHASGGHLGEKDGIGFIYLMERVAVTEV